MFSTCLLSLYYGHSIASNNHFSCVVVILFFFAIAKKLRHKVCQLWSHIAIHTTAKRLVRNGTPPISAIQTEIVYECVCRTLVAPDSTVFILC